MDIFEIYNAVQQSRLKKTLGNNAFKRDESDTIESQQIRFEHLVGLLILFYTIQRENESIYSDQNHRLVAFQKYVRKTVINNYPYKCFGDHYSGQAGKRQMEDYLASSIVVRKQIEKVQIDIDNWNSWIRSLWIQTERAIWKPARNINLGLHPESVQIRCERIFDLSTIMNYLFRAYRLYAEKSNDINKPKNPIYGNKYAMCGFMGNEIIRQYPFKDIIGFESINHKNSKPLKSASRYEHWTPTGIFAKIIAIDHLDSMTLEDWFKFIYYFYRTVRITLIEDSKLEKSLRPINQYEFPEINIQIEQSKEWDYLHNISDAVNYLKSNNLKYEGRNSLISTILK